MLMAYKVTAVCVVLIGSCLLNYKFQTSGRNGINPNQDGAIGHSDTLKYATDDFFAAAFLDLDGILTSESYQNLPFDTFIQSSVLFERYRDSPVKEVAVFLKDGSDLDSSANHEFEVAISAKLKRALASKKDLSAFASSISPNPFQADFPIETVKIGDRECYRIPSGSFLTPRRKEGSLQFIDENGSIKTKGLSVGSFAPRSYIRGGGKAQAKFTFEQVKESDLRNDKLFLNIWLRAFRTRVLPDEFVKGQIFLRRPDGDLISNPITFDANSFKNLAVAFPRKLSATDPKGESREVDLVNDLVVDGRLEIIITCPEDTSYLGFDPQDVAIDIGASEFVALEDNSIVVAQSLKTLKSMLGQKTESQLSQKLKRSGREISVSVDIKNLAERQSFRHFLDTLLLDEIQSYMPKVGFSMSGGALVGELTSGQLLVSLSNRTEARKLQSQMSNDVLSAKELATYSAVESSRRRNVMDQLTGMALPCFELQFPDTNVDREEFEKHLRKTIVALFDNLKIDRTANAIRIRFEETNPLKGNSRMDQLAIIGIESNRAEELFQRESHYLADRIHKRITDRLPNSNAAWLRRAHQNSYNTSVEFDSYASKYDWVRRGINLLLDGGEQNASSTDLIWKSAYYIGLKVGHSDQRRAHQELFSKDEALHQRLEQFIDLDNAHPDGGRIESWLVAQQLFQHCIDEHQNSSSSSSIPKRVLYSRPARMRAGYANSLSERGEIEQAAKEWAKAEQMFADFELLQLDDAPAEDSGSELKNLTRRIHKIENDIEGWIWRANFEQTITAQTLRKLEYDARIFSQEKKSSESFQLYQSAMMLIATEVRNRPEEADRIFLAVQSIVKDYLEMADQTESPKDESLQTTIELFKEFRSKTSGTFQ